MDKLNIFLSYKMPRTEDGSSEKTDIASEFAAELADFSAGRIVAHYAGRFPAGVDWRGEIIETIKLCDIFILLYTGGDQQWEFCLLEAGLFQATHPDRPLVVMHAPGTVRPTALQNLNAVKVTLTDIQNFLSPIFYDDPWAISPDLTPKRFNEIANDLVRIFLSVSAQGTNYDLVPSFVLEMNSSEETTKQLHLGKLPEQTRIKGTQDWQMLFDKGVASDTLRWGNLTDWPVKDVYDLKFSRMIVRAISKDTPGGTFIRPSSQGYGGSLYRIALRRYEEYSNGSWKFYFTAAPIDIPIFGIGDNAENEETRAYHLVNVCWYARRRLILDLAYKADSYATSATVSALRKKALVDEIKDEIASVNIQSFIRKVDQPMTLGHLFPLNEIMNDQELWLQQSSIINAYTENDPSGFLKVVEALGVMKKMNLKYYTASASEFARLVSG